MYLDKIEIHGFKSFGDAVKLNIPKGITGVIGPNGSGKSNVSDAIRWVLGEQSAKSLRGSKMEDIIFAGTEKRKSLGYAEVALTIKNPDEAVPIAYTEIVVKRRIYRSGESEYFINGSTCRLKDVQELFMDTGIGKDGYSIIGQGQIDRVLSSKPEERRTLFEEAAGIYKYKVRKQEAEKKLEKQRENLVRLQDIISEIELRLEPLEVEAEKTTQYLKLKDSLKEIDINIFIFEMERLEIEVTEFDQKIEALEEQLQERHNLQQEYTQKSEYYKAQRDQLYHHAEELIEKLSNLEKQQAQRLNQITIHDEKKVNIERLLASVHQEKKDQETLYQTKTEKLAFLETKLTALEIEKASQIGIIQQDEEKMNRFLQDLQKLEGSIDDSRQNLFDKMREIDLFKAEVQKSDDVQEQMEYRKSQINEQIAMQNSEIQHQEVNCRLFEKYQRESKVKLEDLKRQLDVMESDKQTLSERKMASEKALSTSIQNSKEVERQLKWLQHIKEEHEGYFGSVKQVLQIAKTDVSKWQGIIGVVGELLEVPKAYEIAIVTALGGAIQNIVTQTENDAKAMITTMKQRGISRVTFLPLDTIKEGHRINNDRLVQEVGFLGFGSDLIEYDKQYSHIVSSLLGRIIIVEDMNNASRIAKKYGYQYKIVTLEGEVFNSGGSLSGGSMKNQVNNIFSRSREIKELEKKLRDLNQDIQEQKRTDADIKQKLEALLVNYEKTNGLYVTTSDELNSYSLEYEKSAQALKLIKNNQLQFITERNAIEESIEALQSGQEEVKDKLVELKNTISHEQVAIEDLEKQLSLSKNTKEQMDKELTNKRIQLSSTEQNVAYINEQIAELKADIDGHDEKNVSIERTIEAYKNEIEDLLKKNEVIQTEIEVGHQEIEESKRQRKQLEDEKVKLEIDEKQLTQQMMALNEQVDLLKEEKYRLENKKQNSTLQKQNWGNSMWEQYELTYSHALTYKRDNIVISELKKQSTEIRSMIKQIGNVNVNAVEEYKETKTRYEFLSRQKEDIEKAEEALEQMISGLMEQMKAIFTAQFTIIAKNFSEVFKELFGGGEAYLNLLDEENILESGIEIIAKPPGKKLQNMTLLSGGERTLTAISLIFGILKLKPSPFCVLDEIEAALDDANVLRFADYLERLSSQMQFVVITHRKGTMERAHTLYGVTMQERGVSTILSIQLEDVKHYIEEKKTS